MEFESHQHLGYMMGSGVGAMGYEYYKTVPPDAIIMLDDDDWLPWTTVDH